MNATVTHLPCDTDVAETPAPLWTSTTHTEVMLDGQASFKAIRRQSGRTGPQYTVVTATLQNGSTVKLFMSDEALTGFAQAAQAAQKAGVQK